MFVCLFGGSLTSDRLIRALSRLSQGEAIQLFIQGAHAFLINNNKTFKAFIRPQPEENNTFHSR